MVKQPFKEGDVIKQVGLVEAMQRDHQTVDLFESGILGELTQGHYVILPQGTILLNGIYALLKKYLQIPLSFDEVVLPKVAPVETFHTAALIPHWNPHLLSANPYAETQGIDEKFILDPLQCTVFYEFHRGKNVDVSHGPRKWFDRSGPTYRNESLDELVPGIKQREFHRAEFVYLGAEEQVRDLREQCLGQLEQLFQDLRIGYRIVVGAGCHRFKEDEKTYSHLERDVQVKDIEIYCPGYKPLFLEVSGSSILGNQLTSRFSISGSNGEVLWSGCTGVGLNRMMYAIISNYGTTESLRLLHSQ